MRGSLPILTLRQLVVATAFCVCLSEPVPVKAADLSEAYDLFYQGDYTACIEMCSAEVKRGVWNDGWSRLLMESYFAMGQYEQAKKVYLQVQTKFNSSLPLRFLGAQAHRFCGEGAQGPQAARRDSRAASRSFLSIH
ncbi:MAG: hypothetical protein U0930_24305 [Pirellulales bacterium]